MTSEAFAARLRAFMRNIQAKGPGIVEIMATTGQSLIQDEIQRNGVPGAKYSTNRLPPYYFKGKSINQRGEQYLKDQIEADQGVRWDEFRIEQGLQASKVDLTFSGRMFGGVRVLRKSAKGNVFGATVGGTDKEVDDKLGWQVDRYGPDVFTPNEAIQKEVDEVAQDFLEEMIADLFNE